MMDHQQPISFQDRQDPPEHCRRCDRLIGRNYGGLYYIGEDLETYRRPVCRRCSEIEAAAAEYRAYKERAARCPVVDLAHYRERRQIRAPVSAG